MEITYGFLGKWGKNIYKILIFRWNPKIRKIETRDQLLSHKDLLFVIQKYNVRLINATVQKSGVIYFRKWHDAEHKIKTTAEILRESLVKQYGSSTDLCGHCIEASELLRDIFSTMGIPCHTIEGWCEFDDEYYGSDRPYDPHTWLEIPRRGGKSVYVDITADQFNPGMYEETKYDGIIIQFGLPHGMRYDEPVEYD